MRRVACTQHGRMIFHFNHGKSSPFPQKAMPLFTFQTLPFLCLCMSLWCVLICWLGKFFLFPSLPLPNGKICRNHFGALECLPRWRQAPRFQTAWTLPMFCPVRADGQLRGVAGAAPLHPGLRRQLPEAHGLVRSAGLLQEPPQNSSLLFCCLACDQNAAS